jgi:hypothetical protein
VSGDLIFADRKYRKMGGVWMMQPNTLMRGFIAVAEESTIAMLDEIERLRAAGDAMADNFRRHVTACGVNDGRESLSAWEEARRER